MSISLKAFLILYLKTAFHEYSKSAEKLLSNLNFELKHCSRSASLHTAKTTAVTSSWLYHWLGN